MSPPHPRLAARLASERVELGEAWTAEVSLEAADWMGDAAARLARGYAVTIDYGDPAERLYSERRREGTLRAHTIGTRRAMTPTRGWGGRT